LLTKNIEWYMGGNPVGLGDIAHHVDIIWNALHGTFGEDGKVQRLFEQFAIPYTGSGVLPSALGMHKVLSKERFREAGILTPKHETIDANDEPGRAAVEIIQKMSFPLVVKPMTGGSSVATNMARTLDELRRAIHAAVQYGDVLVEEAIEGQEATVAVIDTGSGEQIVLFPIEIVPKNEKRFFDYDAKYSGATDEICPGRFTLGTHAMLRDLATAAHRAIGAKHYSRSDFIIAPNGIYALEINTLPGLTEESLLPKALKASGVEFSEFLDHVIGLAMNDPQLRR
jgi:D-alanine--D-alanine ligase